MRSACLYAVQFADGVVKIGNQNKRKNAWVNLDLKRRICAMPCAVCGRSDDIECDHIIGIVDGGDSRDSNVQPLCRTCNVLKRWHKTNTGVQSWIVLNREKFEERQRQRTRRLVLIASGEWF